MTTRAEEKNSNTPALIRAVVDALKIPDLRFKILFTLWIFYGVAAMLPDVPKNICYNTLDIFSKNFYGLFIYYKIRELNGLN